MIGFLRNLVGRQLRNTHGQALDNLVERIFRDEDPDNTDILSLLDQLDDFRFYVPLSDKPIVNSSMIKRIIDSCVLNNETVKSILRDAIMEDRLIEEISGEEGAKDIQGKVAKTSPDQGGIETAMAELRSGGYIDNEGAINLSGAKFARHLVKSGYVKPGKSWRPWFRNPEWLDFSEDGVISNNEIQEITKELNWKPFDGVFKDKDGKKLLSFWPLPSPSSSALITASPRARPSTSMTAPGVSLLGNTPPRWTLTFYSRESSLDSLTTIL